MPFLNLTGISLYAVIFLGKMLQEAFSVCRILLISSGKKCVGSIAGFLEVTLYITIVYSVLDGLADDPMKLVVYVVAFGFGLILGMAFEDKLALGYLSIQAVTMMADGSALAAALREAGFGVTILEGKSLDGADRFLVNVHLKRRRVRQAMDIIGRVAPAAVVSQTAVRSVRGGYVR